MKAAPNLLCFRLASPRLARNPTGSHAAAAAGRGANKKGALDVGGKGPGYFESL